MKKIRPQVAFIVFAVVVSALCCLNSKAVKQMHAQKEFLQCWMEAPQLRQSCVGTNG
ncbi:MAG: hypothetical protein ACO1N8_05690 [Methylophilus sp.]